MDPKEKMLFTQHLSNCIINLSKVNGKILEDNLVMAHQDILDEIERLNTIRRLLETNI